MKMRRKNIWTRLLIFGVINSFCISCSKDIDYANQRDYLYVNRTSCTVKLFGYQDSHKENWNIMPYDTLKFSFDLMFGGIPLIPFTCDSVQMIFDDSKQIMFRRNHSEIKNIITDYEEEFVDKMHFVVYTYTIDNDLYLHSENI